jgi:hypothetical protein
MRISSALALLLLTACEPAAPEPNAVETARDNAAEAAIADDDRIDCAPAGARDFARVCTLERVEADGGAVLTLRQPDGGFHRLRQVDDGRGVIAADGSEPAQVTVREDDRIEVAIGGARYRLPARVGPLPK